MTKEQAIAEHQRLVTRRRMLVERLKTQPQDAEVVGQQVTDLTSQIGHLAQAMNPVAAKKSLEWLGRTL